MRLLHRDVEFYLSGKSPDKEAMEKINTGQSSVNSSLDYVNSVYPSQIFIFFPCDTCLPFFQAASHFQLRF